MIDKAQFEEMRKRLEEKHKIRDSILDKSREVISISKKVIYSQQRGNPEDAQKALKEMKEKYIVLVKEIERRPDMRGNNMVRTAGQELIEAASYVAIECKEDIPSAEEFNVDALTYLLGIADLSGELVRSAVLASINADLERVKELRGILAAIYGELIGIDSREGDLRRKIDKVGYDLDKVENLMLDLSLKKK